VDDRLLWRAEGEALGPNPLSLVAWDPAGGRAALLEQAADSGVTLGVRLVDTRAGEELERVETDGGPESWSELAPSPEGRHLLLAEAGETEAHLHLIELSLGSVRTLSPAAPGEGRQARQLLWDGQGRGAAWSRVPLAGAAAEETSIGLLTLDEGESTRSLAIQGGDAAALAFSPDGRFLLVGEREDPFGLGWSRLVIHELDTGARAELGWTLPEDSWVVYWVE
jgi:hypothetical protein